MAYASLTQDDFGSGLYRGRKAPANAVYDCVNGLVNDEGLIFRRGGSAYYSDTDATETPLWLSSAYFAGPATNRVIAAAVEDVYTINASSDPQSIADAFTLATDLAHWGRGVMLGDVFFAPTGPTRYFFYGGSLESAAYTTGTVSVTEGSTTVTGAGTSWLTNVDAGMVLAVTGLGEVAYGVVKSVVSDTSLTLVSPFTGTGAGLTYGLVVGGSTDLVSTFAAMAARSYIAVAGQRLLFCVGNHVYYTSRGVQWDYTDTNYHDIGGSGIIVGAEGRGDNAFIFSTAGVWNIGNLHLDDVDAYGNVQHVVQQVSKEFVLWDDYGIAGWSGGIVLPGVDDVYLASAGFELTPLSARIRPLYRSYVAAGYQPGMARVHRNHYFLPILDDDELVDVLVCRLDRDAAWTRWAGHAAGVAFTTLTAEAAREPKLLGLSGKRVTDLTDTFNPSETNATDADETTSDFVVITNDYPTGGNQPGFAAKVRARYELEAAELIDTFDGSGTLTAPYVAYQGALPSQGSGTVTATSGLEDALRDVVLIADTSTEVLFDPPLAPSGGLYDVGVLLRVDGITSGSDGYSFNITDLGPGLSWVDTLYKSSSFTTLATSPTNLTETLQGIRITAEGSTIKGFIKFGGVWYERLSVTDTTYPNGGRPGFWMVRNAGTLKITSFSWGSPPEVTPEFSSDADADVFAELTDRGEQEGADGWTESDGSLYQWALVGKRRERIRFRFTLAGACSSFVLRTIELLTRPSGKQ